MDIFERLKKDHRLQERLAADLEETSGDSPERRKLFEQLMTEAESHANAEEQAFYAVLFKDPESQETARHGVAEHKDVADLFDELDPMDMSSGGWLQKFKKLKSKLEHHIEEEEKDVFPVARKVLDESQADAMVGDFEKRKADEQS